MRAGPPHSSANVEGDCPTQPCSDTLLSNGSYFISKWVNDESDCEALVINCPRPITGWTFTSTDACEMTRCSSAPAGRYYTNLSQTGEQCQTAPCAEVSPGFRFKRGWATDPDACPTERCEGDPPTGQYFKRGCTTAKCTNAPLGYCYVLHGGVEDACPYAPCTNARRGEFYELSWAVTVVGGKTHACDVLIQPGWMFGDAGSCDVVMCPVAPRGMYFVKGCEHDACTNGGIGTYYIRGFADSKTTCPVRKCDRAPPPGLFFSDTVGCVLSECTNADAGYYYTNAIGHSIVQGQCPTAPCMPPPNGSYFTKGHATSADSCPVAKCNTTLLPVGHYFGANCSWVACPPARAGHYHLLPSTTGESGCASVTSKCTNAGPGQTYVETDRIISSSTGCPVVACSPAPIGRYYTESSQCSRTAPCTGALIGEHYTSNGGGQGDRCNITECDNVQKGEYYSGGRGCEVRKCFRPAGYTFVVAGKCTRLTRCPAAPLGEYYSSQGSELCSSQPCTPTQTKFVPGFATDPDECPQCARKPAGECYKSEDNTCDTYRCEINATTSRPGVGLIRRAINTTLPPVVPAAAVRDASFNQETTMSLIIGISVGGVTLLLVVIVAIVVWRRRRALTLGLGANVTTVIASAGGTDNKRPSAATSGSQILPVRTNRQRLRLLTGDDFDLVTEAIRRDLLEGDAGLRALCKRLRLSGEDRVYAETCPGGFEPQFPSLLAYAATKRAKNCGKLLSELEADMPLWPVTIDVSMTVPQSDPPGAIVTVCDHRRLFDLVVPALPVESAVSCTLIDPAMVRPQRTEPTVFTM